MTRVAIIPHPQVVGMLLEEFVLKLLKTSGYTTVTSIGTDPTLSTASAGICVEGRGGKHQIDAIADYNVPQPFSHPSRLLVEAKAYSRPVGIEVIRNTVGVLHDVNEWWWKDDMSTTYRRHVYNYAVFTLNYFSNDAQMYGFAHGIFLVPLARSGVFKKVIDPMRAAAASFPQRSPLGRRPSDRWLHNLRLRVRSILNNEINFADEDVEITNEVREFCDFVNQNFEGALLANLSGKIPVFLLPTQGTLQYVFERARLGEVIRVRIFWDDEGWYLNSRNGTRLFSFDLPELILQRYANGQRLNRQEALNLKHQEFSNFDAVLVWNGEVTRVRFELDAEWIEELLRQTGIRAQR